MPWKMFNHLIILLFLSWACAQTSENANPPDEVYYDQMATASEDHKTITVSEEDSDVIRDRLTLPPEDTTVHYENFNGFVPMVVTPSTTEEDFPPDDSSFTSGSNETVLQAPDKGIITTSIPVNVSDVKEEEVFEQDQEQRVDKIEDNPAYSTEARIFLNLPQSGTNRRSFEYQENQNGFELLRVRNNTPAIADYQTFYENVENTMQNSQTNEDENVKAMNRDRGKRVENHVGYGLQALQRPNDGTTYDTYYLYNTAKDKKNMAYESEKVGDNYQEQDTVDYSGGQVASAVRQNAPTTPSLVRTNQEITELNTGVATSQNGNYDNMGGSSNSFNEPRHHFSKPVVVAESNNYNVDAKYNEQSSGITNPQLTNYQTSRVIDSASSESTGRYSVYNHEGRYHNYRDEDSRDISDDSLDYSEYPDRSRRLQKGRTRGYGSDNSRKIPKEHRNSGDDSSEYQDHKRHNFSRAKPHRHRGKSHSWMDGDRNHGKGEAYEETKYDERSIPIIKGTKSHHGLKIQSNNQWNQISPNMEISHSSGIQLDQIEKPKFIVPLKVNLVPVSNFDHATALGNSQGFDVSNAVFQNVVTATPVSAVTAANHFLATPEGNIEHGGFSTAAPDIIVGQNTFYSPMQTMLYPSTMEQNKFSANLRPQYVSSTMAPVYAVTPTLSSSLQSVSFQNPPQNTVTSRPTYVAAPSATSTNLQHVSVGQVQPGLSHLLVPQPNLQTLSGLVQPVPSNLEYNIHVNARGMHGQHILDQGNMQVQSLPLMTTASPTVQTVPITKVNLLKAEPQHKKNTAAGSSTNFLASANLAVSQNEPKQPVTGGSYYLQNTNAQQIVKPQTQNGLYQFFKNVNMTPKTKNYIQATHIMPTLLQSLPTINTISGGLQQVIPAGQNQQFFNLQQMQAQMQRNQLFKAGKLSALLYPTPDSIGSHSNNNGNTVNLFSGNSGLVQNAHLPNVGTKNVEILNPNIKPSPIDTTYLNQFGMVHYPTTVLTTPIPMISTTSFVTARPTMVPSSTSATVNLQNYVDSLTEAGSKNNAISVTDLKADQNQDRPMFNPINFVPNMDLVKSQNALNSKLNVNEPLQQNLNLVPLMPGGNFFKPSFSAQSELIVKPKLKSDLEKYAEQMFKESLKTIYNSHKWNNDKKQGTNRHNNSDSIDLAKLKNEIQRLKAAIAESKRNKDHFEGHQSENHLRIAELLKSANMFNDQQKPDQLVAALEEVLKSYPRDHFHSSGGPTRPDHSHKYHGHGSSSNDDLRNSKYVRDFLTPPKLRNPHRGKGSSHDKFPKKRPGSGPPRFGHHSHHGPRSHSRPHKTPSKSSSLETAATNIDLGYHADAPFDNMPHRHYRYNDYHDRRTGSYLDSYPTFTTSSPDSEEFTNTARGHKSSDTKELDLNHPRTHNFFGLLMKNKQLPPGSSQSLYRNRDQIRQLLEDEKRRQQQQFYDDTLKDYLLKTSDSNAYSEYSSSLSGGRKSFTVKSAT